LILLFLTHITIGVKGETKSCTHPHPDAAEERQKKKKIEHSVEASTVSKAEIDYSILQCFVANSLSYSLSDDCFFKNLIYLAKRAPDGYTPPSRKHLSNEVNNTSSDSLNANIWKFYQEIFLSSIQTYFCGLSLDGWSKRGRHLMSFNIICNQGSVHIGTKNIYGEPQDALSLVNTINNTPKGENVPEVMKMMLNKVFYLVADGASANRSASKNLDIYLFWCWSHVLSLFVETLAKAM
jgi:hypothetical protein